MQSFESYLPEPVQTSILCADTKAIEGIIKDKLSVSDTKICKVLRLGKRTENAPDLFWLQLMMKGQNGPV